MQETPSSSEPASTDVSLRERFGDTPTPWRKVFQDGRNLRGKGGGVEGRCVWVSVHTYSDARKVRGKVPFRA